MVLICVSLMAQDRSNRQNITKDIKDLNNIVNSVDPMNRVDLMYIN